MTSSHDKSHKNCIFCKIVNLQEDASLIYQDELCMAFMDTSPLAEGHCLIIPKKHVVLLNELTQKTRIQLMKVADRVVNAQRQAGFGESGTNILINDGKAANQTIPHLHIHLIPRKRGDLITAIPKIIMHITGVFGLRAPRKKLNQQAQAIAATLQ